MSEDNLPKITLSIRGLDDVIMVAHELPKIPLEAIPGILERIREVGVDEAKVTMEKTATSEKSTGITAILMTSILEALGEDFLIQIGPDTRGLGEDADYPKFLSQPTGPVTQNRAVQLLPYPLRYGFNPLGRWRFIGVRPRIEGHPWMENTRDRVLQEISQVYGKELYRMVGELNKRTKQINVEGQIGE